MLGVRVGVVLALLPLASPKRPVLVGAPRCSRVVPAAAADERMDERDVREKRGNGGAAGARTVGRDGAEQDVRTRPWTCCARGTDSPPRALINLQ